MARSRRGVNSKRSGVLVEEAGGDFAGLKRRVVHDVFEERDVGLDAADAELTQCAVHAMAGLVEIAAGGGDFHQQRIVEGRDGRAAVCGAAIQTHAEAAGGAVGVDACRNPA